MKAKWFYLFLFCAVCVSFLTGNALLAQKTDTLYLKDHTIHIGEIQILQYGKLSFNTKYMGTPSITWANVARLISDKPLSIKTVSGKIHHGSLLNSNADFFISVLDHDDSLVYTMPISSVIGLVTVKKKIAYRFYGSIDAGFSYTKASDLRQWNIGGNIGYRANNNDLNFNLNSINTFQGDIDKKTIKQELGITGTRYLPNKLLLPGFVSFEQNSELGIDLRTIVGIGVGRDIVQKPKNRFSMAIAPLYNNEQYSDSLSADNKDQTTFEGLARLQWKVFNYSLPELDFSTGVSYYYNLSTGDRHRVNMEVNFQFEIIDDVFLVLSFWDNYDSNPPSETASNNDWGTTMSIRYKFKQGQRQAYPKKNKKNE